jgi:hypothetical protein
MASNFSISKLKEAIGGELLRPNRFEVVMNPPVAVQTYLATEGITLTIVDTLIKASILTERGEIPGRTFATADTNRAGPQFKSVYDTTYNDITFSLVADSKLKVRSSLEGWMDYIYRPGNTTTNSGGVTRFHDDYVGTVTLSQLNSSGDAVATYTLHNAYPIQISSMPFSAEENDTYQRFTVDFTYRYHTQN